MKNIYHIVVVILCLNMIACNSNSVIHAYVVVQSGPEYIQIDDMRPVIRVTYRIEGSEIISELAGLVEEYEECNIINIKNWQCQYSDGTGINQFGFTKGKYWKSPITDASIKYVSRWEYNIIRCKWYQYYRGMLEGLSSCVKTYI